MDRDMEATLCGRTAGSDSDTMITTGRLEDLVRQFKKYPEAVQREHLIAIG